MRKIVTITLNPAFDVHYTLSALSVGHENYATGHSRDAGGKGINISRALAQNGIDSAAYVLLGKADAAAFEAALTADGVRYAPVYVDGRIRENVTLHPADQKETRISLEGAPITAERLSALEHTILAGGVSGALVAFAGRIPAELPKSEVLAFLGRLKAAGAEVLTDSNSLAPADWEAIRPVFIKPNEDEIAAALGRTIASSAEAGEAASALRAKGIANVMISLGGAGAVLATAEGVFSAAVPKIAPLSTVGAGDSTVAGYLSGVSEGLPTAETLRRAVSFGTAACLTPGTKPPRPADVAAIAAEVRVTRLG